MELAEFAARELKPYGFSFVQIDDKWQMGKRRNGPGKNFTTHDPQGPYAHGMEAVAARLGALGFTPGIWFMPFAGDHLDPYFRDHAEWFVKHSNGEFYETKWGGTSLDMTELGAREHLRNVVKTIRSWGYRYFKMDGLWTGTATEQVYVNDGYVEDGIGDAVFHNPDKTNIEAMRDGLKLVRQAARLDVFFSGCNLSQNMRSFSGSVGLVDSMRIGPDNGSDWPRDPNGAVVGSLLAGPLHGSRKYFLHGRVWWNDPDPIYVRAAMPLSHARLIASWVAISGQFYLNSDWLPGLPADRLDIIRRTIPSHGLLPRPVDLFEHPIPRIWLLSGLSAPARRDVIALYNWDSEEKMIECPMDKIGLDGKRHYHAFDFWGNELLPPIQGTLHIAVPAQSCRILALRAASNQPQLLSTSRHVTQGIVDVVEERWDASRSALLGWSKVVANDSYELRVIVPADPQVWKLKSAEVSAEDQAAGVKVSSIKAEPSLLRISVQSPASRELRWTLRFVH